MVNVPQESGRGTCAGMEEWRAVMEANSPANIALPWAPVAIYEQSVRQSKLGRMHSEVEKNESGKIRLEA